MTTILKAWGWVRLQWKWLLGAVVAAAVFLFTAGTVAKRVRSRRDIKRIQEAKTEVAKLRGKMEAAKARDIVFQSEIDAIEKRRSEVQRETVAIDHDVAEMSEKEVEDAFRRMY